MNLKFSKTVILAGDAIVAEQICRRLRKPGVYLPVIEEPMIRLVEYGVFDKDCIRVGNTIRILRPRVFLCVKVHEEVITKMKECFPELQPVRVERYDEPILRECVELNTVPVPYESVLTSGDNCCEDLFVVEGSFGMANVIAANLAVAHGGKVLPIEAVTDDDVDLLADESWCWSNGSWDEKQQSKAALFGFLRSRLPPNLVESQKLKSVTFITKSVPYGVLPFSCPTTHCFSFPLLGVNILAGMLKSGDDVRCPIAVLIDPSLVGQSEFATLRKTLGEAGYYLREALGENASVKFATYLSEHLPSDFIFYSTHCGEVQGQRVTERFPDKDGNPHIVCYDRALSGFRSPTKDLFEITVGYYWLSLDGVSWADEEKKTAIRAGDLLKDYLAYSKKIQHTDVKPELLSVIDCGPVKGSDSLAMNDSNFVPTPRVVGGYHYPVVFNNACSSWRAFAMTFGCGGASVYVGTATAILGTSVGVLTANKFTKEITGGKTVGSALYRSQKNLIAEFGYTPYLMHGYLYTKLRNPSLSARHSRVRQRLLYALKITDHGEGLRQESAAVEFLKGELRGLANTQVQG